MKIDSLAQILLVLMFLYSGTNKVTSLGRKEMKKLTRLGLSRHHARSLNFLAGILEVTASLIVLLSVTGVKMGRAKDIALKALIAFTALVTVLFKIWPRPSKLLGLTANLAVIGGLLLAL
jgi:uncharacterized membrane protein YphA (DoxX/SURF4 family)